MKKHLSKRIIPMCILILVGIFALRSGVTAVYAIRGLNTAAARVETPADSWPVPGSPDGQTTGEYRHMVGERNKALSLMGAADIVTTITFSRHMTYEEAMDYAARHGLEVIELHAKGTAGRALIGADGQTGANLEAQGMEDRVTGLNALVDSTALKAVEADPDTFLADTTGDGFCWWNTMPFGVVRNGGRQNFQMTLDVYLNA